MHDPTWFANMEREQAEREDYREQVAFERQQQEEAIAAARNTAWACPYCGNIIGHEPSQLCCGEYGHEIEVYEDTGEPVEN